MSSMKNRKVKCIERAIFLEIVSIIKHSRLTPEEKTSLLHCLQQSIARHLPNLQNFNLLKEKSTWKINKKLYH